MEIGQLEQKLLNRNHLDTDGRRRQTDDRHTHNIIRSQKFLRPYNKKNHIWLKIFLSDILVGPVQFVFTGSNWECIWMIFIHAILSWNKNNTIHACISNHCLHIWGLNHPRSDLNWHLPKMLGALHCTTRMWYLCSRLIRPN